MIHTQEEKVILLLGPAANVNNSTLAPLVIDKNGYDYLDIYVMLGATDIGFTTMKLNESDVKGSSTTLTGGTLVPGSDFSVLPALLPTGSNGSTIYAWHLNDNGPRKRYVLPNIVVGVGTTTFVTMWAVLSRADQRPNTAAKRGLGAELFV